MDNQKIKDILDELEHHVFDSLEDMYSEETAAYYRNKFIELKTLLDVSGNHIPEID